MSKNNQKFTILIPACNSLSTIAFTLKSILKLNPKLIQELIYIDDASTDGSLEFVRDMLSIQSKIKFKIISNKIPQGLAKGYNYGIKNSKSRYLLTAHQDIELRDSKALEKILKTFESNNRCVLVCSILQHPRYLLKKYNIWMRVQFSRVIQKGDVMSSSGKFDTYDLQRLKFSFDDETFKFSGEDIDFDIRMREEGQVSLNSGVRVIHNHNFKSNYSFLDYLKKENQYNETYGVVLRKWFMKKSPLIWILLFHRLLLVISLFIPYLNNISIFLILFYVFYYSWYVFYLEYKNPKIILVPFANLAVLFCGAFWNIAGFIKGRQSI